MPRRPRQDLSAALDPAAASERWWATLERDRHRCRVAAFLPDLACAGALNVYDPTNLEDPNPPPERAVTICDGHLAWVRENRAVAIALGLAAG